MSLDCAIDNIVKPITCFFFKTVKDYVSYIRSYDENMDNLKTKLEELSSKKKDINTKVKIGRDKLENMSKEAAIWLQSVRKLSQDEELKGFILREHMIAEMVLKLMDEKDLKKILRDDKEMQDVVVKMVVKEDNNQVNFEKVTKVAMEVMKDTMEELKKVIKEDIKVAMVMTKLLEDEKLAKLSEGDVEMAEILKKAREMCEEKLWEVVSDDEDVEHVRKLPRPLEKLVQNQSFMEALPENVKLGVEMVDGLWKGSVGLKDEITASATKKHTDRCCHYFGVPFKHFHNRYEMSKSAEIIANNVQSIVDKTPKDPVTLPGRTQDLKLIPSGFLKGLESREKLLQQILVKLDDNQVNIVGVYGMGGSGKTTLMKEVNSKVKRFFDTNIMVEISETPTVQRIQDQLAEALNLPLKDVHNSSLRAQKLYHRLKPEKEQRNDTKTKILIILDNMWNKLDLSEVGIPYESTDDFCCKLLVTSRKKNVCQMMDIKDENIFQLGLLNDNESEELFYNHVGIERLHQTDYKSVGQRLLSKCDGLSLTIVATANALKGKDLQTWKHFADELEKPVSSQISGLRRETYAILETSYKFIESKEKKMFFLLVCLSPLGSSTSIETLMRYGIGLELFQHVNKLSEVFEQVETWVAELVSSSLLIKSDSYLFVKIHDDVRASAISFAVKDKHEFLVEAIPRWMRKETFNKYTAISLLSGGRDFSRLKGVKAEMLKILLLKGNLSNSSELDDCFFQGMTNLKVLELSYMNLEPELPKSIGQLDNLNTLHLEHCKLGKISLICELSELLVVSLRDSDLKELPNEMGKLVNLLILDMRGCEVNCPANTNIIASLTSLEGLYLFKNFKEWAITTSESNDCGGTSKKGTIAVFNELPHLNLLEVEVEKPMHLPLGHFSEKLDNFRIHFGDETTTESDDFDNNTHLFEIPEIDSLSNCRVLVIKTTLNDNSCLEALIKRANYIRLYETKLSNNFIPELDVNGCRDLKYLQLSKCSGMECVVDTDWFNDLIAFQNLEYLYLYKMNDLKLICKGKAPPGMFSNLRRLELKELNNLEYALPSALLPRNLTHLDIYECESLKVVFDESDRVPSDGDDPTEQDLDIHLPLLKTISIKGANALIGWSGPAAKQSNNPEARLEGQAFFKRKMMCSSLELLELKSCDNIEYIWSKELDMSIFGYLNKIQIYCCKNLKSLGLFSDLRQLERLSIKECENMKYVFNRETEEFGIHQRTIQFPRLEEIFLGHLKVLEGFNSGGYKVEFPKLKKLSLDNLPKLKFLNSEDPTTSFIYELEILSVENCGSMKYVISKETKELDVPQKTIKFRQLRELRLHRLQGLENFYRGDYKVEFPKLKKMSLRNLTTLTAFVGSEDPTTFFSDKMMCSSLELLELNYCGNIEYIWSKELDMSKFGYLNKIEICSCKNLKSLGLSSGLRQLESLSIKKCKNMKYVFNRETEELGIHQRTIQFPKLEEIILVGLEVLESFNSGGYKVEFPKLKKLSLDNLPNLKFLDSEDRTTSFIDELEILSVENCGSMKYVISKETKELDVPQKTIKFRQLRELRLHRLQGLENFYRGDYKVEFPKLKKMSLRNLTTLTAFVGSEDPTTFFSDKVMCPSLEILELHSLCNIEYLWSKELDMSRFRKLKVIKVEKCDNLKSLGSASVFFSLMQLGILYVKSCKNMVNVITKETEELEIPENTIEFQPLQELELRYLPKCKSFYGGSYRVKFPNLKKLALYLPCPSATAVVGVQDLTTLFSDMVQFPYLEELFVGGGSLENKDEQEEEEGGRGHDKCVVLPRLKTLELYNLSICSFSSEPDASLHLPSLETITIKICKNLQVFWAGPLVAPKLKHVEVNRCEKMQHFLSGNPSRVVELLSLEKVIVRNAKNMQSLTAGPLKAPNLSKPQMEYLKSMN